MSDRLKGFGNAPAVTDAPDCDRCKQPIKDYAPPDPETGVTAGYYDVSEGSGWETYANPGEKRVCDDCMHRHPIYAARHMTFPT
jgi:hypothetical protein